MPNKGDLTHLSNYNTLFGIQGDGAPEGFTLPVDDLGPEEPSPEPAPAP